ncbi:MAG: hypothetical protein U9R48_04675 [Chloroflexota bacterium]|nr:hypothetical protein [Chloroflexota bacterium]
MEGVQVFFFGPSEVTIATDPDLYPLVEEIIESGEVPKTCKWCSDKYHISELLEEIECSVEYFGSPVSEPIKAGYTPMT